MSRNKHSKNKGSKYIGTLQRRSRNTPQGGNFPTLFLLKGSLQVTRSGMGFVIPEDPAVEGDVMVRPQEFHSALNGDKVDVAVFKNNKSTGKKEGKIERIIQRKQVEFVGHIELSDHFAFFVADGNKPIPDIYIPLENTQGAEDKSKVIVRLLKWDQGRKPLGKVIAKLAQEDINDAAMKELLTENGFPIQFEKEVIAAADALPVELDKKEIKKRADFRKKLTFTIDPNDSKDFDDAISFRKISKDKFEVGVHIADVSYYVQPGSILDKEAYKRATSVYLPDRVNPMLPENISNVLCSLRPNEDKFTFSTVFTIDLKGNVLKRWIGKTAIHSDKRYTYDEVQEVIKGGDDSFKDAILTLNTISQALRAKRFEKGAINFSSHEVRFKLDAKGKPVDIILNETNESHQLIEELMLLANRTIAEYAQTIKVDDKPVPFPYRIHDQPDSTKLEPFVAFTRKLGYKFDLSAPETIAVSFNKMLEACEGKPEEMMIQQLGIRTMAKAAYAPENIGHYGLGFKDYCHFTSPIRRYPDVIVHRVIEACLDGNKPVDAEMGIKCKHCSERERASLETERAANKYKQVEFMREFVGDEFEAIISGVSNFGFWAETITAKCEGLVSIKDLANFDEFNLIEEDYALVGTRTATKFRMGDHVWIRVVSANLEKRQIDYEWLSNASSEAKKVESNTPKPVEQNLIQNKVVAETKIVSKKKTKTPDLKESKDGIAKVKKASTSKQETEFAPISKTNKMKKKETPAVATTIASKKSSPKKSVAKVTPPKKTKSVAVKAAVEKKTTPKKKTAAAKDAVIVKAAKKNTKIAAVKTTPKTKSASPKVVATAKKVTKPTTVKATKAKAAVKATPAKAVKKTVAKSTVKNVTTSKKTGAAKATKVVVPAKVKSTKTVKATPKVSVKAKATSPKAAVKPVKTTKTVVKKSSVKAPTAKKVVAPKKSEKAAITKVVKKVSKASQKAATPKLSKKVTLPKSASSVAKTKTVSKKTTTKKKK